MAIFTTVLIWLFWLALLGLSGLAGYDLTTRMMDEADRDLPPDQRTSMRSRSPFDYWRLSSKHKAMYPESDLRRKISFMHTISALAFMAIVIRLFVG